MADFADYLKKQIEQLAGAIANALHHSSAGPNPEARQQLDEQILATTGIHVPLLQRLGPETVISMLGIDRAMLIVEALEARAWLSSDTDLAESVAASRRLQHALRREPAYAAGF